MHLTDYTLIVYQTHRIRPASSAIAAAWQLGVEPQSVGAWWDAIQSADCVIAGVA